MSDSFSSPSIKSRSPSARVATFEDEVLSLRLLRRQRLRPPRMIREFPLVVVTTVAFFAGLFFGCLMRTRQKHYNNEVLFYWLFLGNTAANVLRILILPLLITEIFTTTLQMSCITSAKIFLSSIVVYLVMHMLAALEAFAWSFIISPKPEIKSHDENGVVLESAYFLDILVDFTRNVIPEDFTNATIFMSEIVLTPPKPSNETNQTEIPIEDWPITYSRVAGPNYIGLLLTVAVFGSLTHLLTVEKIIPLVKFMEVTGSLLIDLSHKLSWVSPVITFCFVLSEAIMFEISGPSPFAIRHCILLLILVTFACIIHVVVFLPIIYCIFLRKNPIPFFANILQPALLAFSTSSSTAVLPVTLDCVIVRNKGFRRMSTIVLFTGGAIQMSGTVMYTTIALVYLSQIYDVHFQFMDYFLMVFMIPISVMCLTSSRLIMPRIFRMCGVPMEAVLIISSINCILNRVCAVLNVVTDAVTAAILSRFFPSRTLSVVTVGLEQRKHLPSIGY